VIIGDQLKSFIANQYQQLFLSAVGAHFDEVLDCVDRRVTREMNKDLLLPFTGDEIWNALDNIGDLKAPGADGIPSIFYKKFWSVVGDQVKKEVLAVLNGGPIPEGWNDTIIVLIPKTNTPQMLKDLRPISLCNVLYKLISKVLANRLKKILPNIISNSQSAFVPGRLITDNVLLAYEIVHHLKSIKKGAGGLAAIKLDMSKAYDRVEWSFLENMMRKMGFDEKWVQLIMKCVTTVTYKIKVNDSYTQKIFPQRGLRQGDPLSSYLFIICAEGLSAMLQKAEQDGKIEGIKICRGAPKVNHLFFADDSLILMRARASDALELRRILDVYEKASGQVINKEKSSMMFSPNTGQHDRSLMRSNLSITDEASTEKYLGLPVNIGKSRKKPFEYIKRKIWSRIQGWQEKLLSKAGKEILIKAVAQSIPTYAMSCFDLTKGLCDELSSIIGRYWWSQQDKANKIHWISWEKLTQSKEKGGLGFRDLHLFNLAMLSRQAWRLLTNPDSLCGQVLKARYFPHSDILHCSPRPRISYTWRSILKGVALLKEGIIWRIGNGKNVKIWEHPWIPKGITRKPITPRGASLLTRVNELINPVTGEWDEQLVNDLFWPQDAEEILQIPIDEHMEDWLAWHFDATGLFSVKSAYKLAVSIRDADRGDDASSSKNEVGEEGHFNWIKI